jgi:hypothetical protein
LFDEETDPFVRPDVGSLGFCELRLARGVWQCTVPFWGVRHLHQLKQISMSDEMEPWRLGNSYDKPIARRLIEDAGAPRKSFGQIKKNVSLPDPFLWPRSSEAEASFRRYVLERRGSAPRRWQTKLIRKCATVENLLYSNLLYPLGLRKRYRPWKTLESTAAIYCWANEELRSRYADGLRESSFAGPQLAETHG